MDLSPSLGNLSLFFSHPTEEGLCDVDVTDYRKSVPQREGPNLPVKPVKSMR